MKLNFVYATDENYVRYCGTSIYSPFYINKILKKLIFIESKIM